MKLLVVDMSLIFFYYAPTISQRLSRLILFYSPRDIPDTVINRQTAETRNTINASTGIRSAAVILYSYLLT